MEDCQLGMSTGIALAGGLPLSVFPRWDFLLLATNQLVLHLDKIARFSNGGYRPRVLIRTAVPTPIPLDPGAQHHGNHGAAFSLMLTTVRIVALHRADEIVTRYQEALDRDGSTILVEHTGLYA
jgi:pyruvate/2-oxoglutarate/acetoin dehydrogenase E1 component